MKRAFVWFFISLLILTSCGSGSNGNSAQDLYQKEIDKAFSDAESIKCEDAPFFLGFQMGMSPKQVKEQCSKLVSSGKITRSGKTYKYNIKDSNIEEVDFQTELRFDYFNDELSRLTLYFTGKNSQGQRYITDMSILFKIEFSRSWGTALEAQSYTSYLKKDVFDEYQYYYIKGNIIATCDDDSYDFYDAYREKLKSEAHKESVAADLIGDFNM